MNRKIRKVKNIFGRPNCCIEVAPKVGVDEEHDTDTVVEDKNKRISSIFVEEEYYYTLDGEVEVHVVPNDFHIHLNNLREASHQLYRSTKCCRKSPPNYADPKPIDYARELMDNGNLLMKKKHYPQAMNMYSSCIAEAPLGSVELCLAYANRAAACYSLGFLESAVLDINRALAENCPSELKSQLTKRKYAYLGDRIIYTKKPPTIDARSADRFKLMCEKNEMEDENNEWCTFTDLLASDKNTDLPNSSDKLKVEYDEQGGHTFLRATQDIEPGEFLLVEKLFAGVLVGHRRNFNCNYCFRERSPLIPCTTCTMEMYCSKSCREKAFTSYHRTECKMVNFYEHINGRDMRVFYVLALREFLIGTEQGKKLPELMEKLRPQDILKQEYSPPRVPFETDYMTILTSLMTRNRATLKSGLSSIANVSKCAIDAVIALESVSFFNQIEEPSDDLTDVKYFAVLLLMNHLISLVRAMEIYDQRENHPTVAHPIGFCDFMFHHFFIHSCNPNTNMFIRNRHRLMYAIRPIKAGERLSYTHMPHSFAYVSIACRQEYSLKYYKYVCECEACLNEWPMLEDLKDRKIQFKGSDQRQMKIDLLNELKSLNCSNDSMEITEVHRMLIEHLEVLYRYLEVPSFDIFRCEELLIRVMSAMYSDISYPEYDISELFQCLSFSIRNRIDSDQ